MRREQDLDLLAADFDAPALADARGPTAPDPGVGRALRVWDPFGFPLEFFHEMEQVETQLQRFDLHRGAPIMRFDHFNLHTPAMEEAFAFWTGLGFRCSEYISTDGADERITGAWLLRKPTVHDVALTAGRGPAAAPRGLLGRRAGRRAARLRPARRGRSCARRSSADLGGTASPTRSSSTCAIPDGHRIELYACDYYTGDPDLEPLRWSVNDVRCRSFWGTRAPDSWYDESSSILGAEGQIVELEDPSVDERSEVMA